MGELFAEADKANGATNATKNQHGSFVARSTETTKPQPKTLSDMGVSKGAQEGANQHTARGGQKDHPTKTGEAFTRARARETLSLVFSRTIVVG